MTITSEVIAPPAWLNLSAVVTEAELAAIESTADELEALLVPMLDAIGRASALMDSVEDSVSAVVDSADDEADGVHQGVWKASRCYRLEACFLRLSGAMNGHI